MAEAKDVAEVDFYFLKINPGSEERFCQAHLSGVAHWEGLGKYDLLCATSPDGSRRDSKLVQGCRLYAQDLVHLRLFRLPGSSDPLAWLRESSASQNWLAITLLKVPLDLELSRCATRVAVHAVIAKRIEKECEDQGVRVIVLGGYGWHELAMLAAGDSLTRLADTVVKVARSTDEGKGLIQKSFTTLGYNRERLGPEADREWAKEDEEGERLRAASFIICRRSPTARMMQSFEDRFKADNKPALVFGSEDVLVSNGAMSVPEFIRSVMKLRKESCGEGGVSGSGDVLATSTFVGLQGDGLPLEDGEEVIGKAAEAAKGIPYQDLEIKLAERIVKEEAYDADAADVVQHATRLELVLKASLRSDLVRDAYLDMVPFLASCTEQGLPSISTARVVLDYTQAGYQQRFAGTFNTIWNTGDPTPLLYRAGVQRVLWAVEYVCHSLLKRSLLDRPGSAWTGFAVFGQLREYLRTHRGIINIPHRAIFDPSLWFGILHEIGHEYAYLAVDQDNHWATMVAEAFGLPEKGHARHEVYWYTDELTWEVLADLFNFRFGMHGDWDLYCNTVFGYQVNLACNRGREQLQASRSRGATEQERMAPARERFKRYLARLHAVYWYKERGGCLKEEDEAGPLEAFKEDIGNRLKRIADCQEKQEGHGLRKVAFDSIRSLLDGNEMDVFLQGYAPVGRLLGTSKGHEILNKAFRKEQVEEPYPGDLKRDMDQLEQGQPLEKVPQPERIICELARRDCSGKPIPVAMRTATILSFWNQYARLLPDVVGEALDRLKASQAGR